MRVVDINGKTITEYDLSVGKLYDAFLIKEEAEPIDNMSKFAWADEDYEEGKIYIPNGPEPEPSQLDILEAQVTYTAMMTDTLLEG